MIPWGARVTCYPGQSKAKASKAEASKAKESKSKANLAVIAFLYFSRGKGQGLTVYGFGAFLDYG